MAEPTRAAGGKFIKADTGTAVLDAPKEKELTKDELSGLRIAHANLMGRKLEDEPTDEEKAAEAEKVKAKAEADAKAKAKADAAAKRKAATPAPKVVAQTEPLTADAIGEAVAKRLQPKPEAKKEDAPNLEEGLGDDERETLSVLKEMEALYPERYKAGTITAKFAEGQRKLNAYIADWQKANPGQEFDIHGQEHAEFLDKNDVDWPDRDFKAAERSLLRKEVKGEIVKELAPKLSAIDKIEAEKEQLKKLAAAEGPIKATQVERTREYWSGIGPEYSELMRADGSVDNEAWAEMHKSDPQKAVVIVDASYRLFPEVAEAKKLFDQVVPFDGESEIHKELFHFLNQHEKEMLAGPPEEQLDAQGRQLINPGALAKLPESERGKYWLLGRDELLDALVADRTASAKKAVAIIERGTITGSEAIGLIKEGKQWLLQSIEEAFKKPKKGEESRAEENESPQLPVNPPNRAMSFSRSNANPKPNSPGATGDSKLAAHTRANGNGGKNDDPTSTKAFLRR